MFNNLGVGFNIHYILQDLVRIENSNISVKPTLVLQTVYNLIYLLMSFSPFSSGIQAKYLPYLQVNIQSLLKFSTTTIVEPICF